MSRAVARRFTRLWSKVSRGGRAAIWSKVEPPPPVRLWHAWVRRGLSSWAARRLGRFCRRGARAFAVGAKRLRTAPLRAAALECWVLADVSVLDTTAKQLKPVLAALRFVLKSKQLKRQLARCCCGWVSVYAVVYAASRILARKTAPRRLAQEKRGGNDYSLKGSRLELPQRRAVALPPRDAAKPPRSAPRGQNTARRPPKNNLKHRA